MPVLVLGRSRQRAAAPEPLMIDLLSLLSPYEISVAETVDDVELFAWWRETRNDPAHRWARLLPEDLSVTLFDAGIRSVRQLAKADGQDWEILATLTDLAGWQPPLWQRLMEAAQHWEPWPAAFRRQLAVSKSLRLDERERVDEPPQR